MNEVIDASLIGAKVLTKDNVAASLATHCLSTAYYIGQMARCRVEYINSRQAMMYGDQPVSMSLVKQEEREMTKYAILTGLGIASLFIFSAVNWNRQR